MAPPDAAVVEQIVVMFPALAAWTIVLLVGVIAAGGAFAVKKFLGRMDTQDTALQDIKVLLASEVKQLREMHHGMDVRVARLEEYRRLENYGRRAGDHSGGGAE